MHRKDSSKGQQSTSELGLTLHLIYPGDIRGRMEVCFSDSRMAKKRLCDNHHQCSTYITSTGPIVASHTTVTCRGQIS